MSGFTRGKFHTVLAAVAMLAMSGTLVYYSVPLYRLFCQVTGFGGTTQRGNAAPGAVSDRTITVEFNADTSSRLPWVFRPEQHKVTVKVGEEKIAYFFARNRSGKPTTGSAIFNVSPAKAGPYFVKIQCFCFTKQHLASRAQAEMPVTFYIDPGILDDRGLDDVDTITLSYVMYPSTDSDTAGQTAEGAGGKGAN